jgi:hypothetical protein
MSNEEKNKGLEATQRCAKWGDVNAQHRGCTHLNLSHRPEREEQQSEQLQKYVRPSKKEARASDERRTCSKGLSRSEINPSKKLALRPLPAPCPALLGASVFLLEKEMSRIS